MSARTCRSGSIAAGEPDRPFDRTPVDTEDLPETPIRDRSIPASAWRQAPAELLRLGEDLPGRPEPAYLRRIEGWLLWRAGPPARVNANSFACRAEDPTRSVTFRYDAEGTGFGLGPTGSPHERFRTWKEDLRDNPSSGAPAAP